MISLKKYTPALFIPLAAALTVGCSTTVGNPQIIVNMGSFPTARLYHLVPSLIPSAQAAVLGLTLCFRRVRFKVDQSGGDGGHNYDFTPGELTIDPTGTTLGKVELAAGTYRRVEFDLEKNCPGATSNNSVQLVNDRGVYSTAKTITLKFEGEFQASENDQVLNLGIHGILTALDAVTTDDEIKDRVEAVDVKGSF